jgi:hypothetical protein
MSETTKSALMATRRGAAFVAIYHGRGAASAAAGRELVCEEASRPRPVPRPTAVCKASDQTVVHTPASTQRQTSSSSNTELPPRRANSITPTAIPRRRSRSLSDAGAHQAGDRTESALTRRRPVALSAVLIGVHLGLRSPLRPGLVVDGVRRMHGSSGQYRLS